MNTGIAIWQRYVVAGIVGSLLFLSPDAVQAQPAAPPSDRQAVAVPDAFSRPAPNSVADLKAIQTHVTRLVPPLSACTVNLKIGRAQGSGVIVSPQGHVLTAAHVSGQPGNDVTITTRDGKRFQGISLGRNTMLDASMVKIQSERTDWPYCPLARQPARPGDWCLVLGHPGGYQRERGAVLRLGRVIVHNDWLIQSDCELVGGDSGGPLFNMQGEVIGINTRIGESTEFNFHVPAEVYARDWHRLAGSEDFRTHSGAYLGISGITRGDGPGLLIQKVYPGDPADLAGIQEGDILIAFQGKKVTDLQQLIDLVGAEHPGQSVKLSILRDGETREITLRLAMRLE